MYRKKLGFILLVVGLLLPLFLFYQIPEAKAITEKDISGRMIRLKF